MRTANRVRSPERAAAAQNERTAALVKQLVDQLGQMRGAAMKVGQVLSMVEFEGLPEDERRRAPSQSSPSCAMTSRQSRSQSSSGCCDRVRGAPLPCVLRVRRAGICGRLDRPGAPGDDPRGAKRWSSRCSIQASPRPSRPTCATPCSCCRSSSGSRRASTSRRSPPSCVSGSPRSSTMSSRRRTSGGSGVCCRGHPFISVPGGQHRALDATGARVGVRRRVSGSSWCAGSTSPSATATGRLSSASTSACSTAIAFALGDPHPGNYLLRPDGRVGFLDYGLLRDTRRGACGRGGGNRTCRPSR